MSLHHWYTKHWKKQIFLVVLLAFGCATKSKVGQIAKKEDAPPEETEITISSEKVLVEDGDSSQASFSPSGDRIIFVSAKRPAHVQSQVYERDLKTGAERRITFQNGSNFHPRFHPKEKWIIYASSTDELKENPPLLNLDSTPPNKLPSPYAEPVEIYLHSLSGLEIRRVTSRKGFDGEAHFSSNGKNLTWTRVINEHTQIMSLPQGSPNARTINNLGENPTNYVVSDDGKSTVWIEWDASFGVSRLRLKRGKLTSEIASETIVTKSDPAFTPDSRWLIWAQKEPQTNLYGLWGYELATGCLHHFLFSSEGDRRDPVVSPDMKTLVYTLVSRGKSRIMQVPFAPRSGACAPAS